MTDWEIHGMSFGNCNCAYGCPCQFNALPTHGDCRAVDFVRIDEGCFGDVRLDGLSLAFAVAWPGPVHQGRGTMQPVVDRRGDDRQRDALLRIMTGKDTDPMATVFAVYTAMCERVHEPVAADIRIELDMEARTAHCEARGVITSRGEPIRNPVTKAAHRVGILLPHGFEYTQNEVGRGWSTSSGAVAMELKDSYAHWYEIHMNQHGVIREPRRSARPAAR
jgi:hypothetical protein